jgi:glycyl-tRNA synthetase
MEIEYFVAPDTWEENFEKLLKEQHEFLTDVMGLDSARIHDLEVEPEDRAHYSKRTVDIEFDYPNGREELMGLAYRTDFDLQNIQRESGKNMEYIVKGGTERFVPHVIEPSIGVERLLLAVLTCAYRQEEKRVVLALPENLAPYRFCVSPLLKNKPELVTKAREVYSLLREKYHNVTWDDSGNIGKRYLKQDEIGTPKCIVIDFDTLEDGTVTVRDRDTTEQIRVLPSEL